MAVLDAPSIADVTLDFCTARALAGASLVFCFACSLCQPNSCSILQFEDHIKKAALTHV